MNPLFQAMVCLSSYMQVWKGLAHTRVQLLSAIINAGIQYNDVKRKLERLHKKPSLTSCTQDESDLLVTRSDTSIFDQRLGQLGNLLVASSKKFNQLQILWF